MFELNKVLGNHRDFKYYANRYVQGLWKTKEHEKKFPPIICYLPTPNQNTNRLKWFKWQEKRF